MSRAIAHSVTTFARISRFAAGAALAILLALIVALILARYLSISLPWADELARMSFVWMVALGAVSGLESRAHFAMSFFTELAPPGLRSFLERLLAAIAAAILILMLVSLSNSIPVVRFSMMPATGLSRAWLQAPLVVFATLGAFFMTARALLPDPAADE